MKFNVTLYKTQIMFELVNNHDRETRLVECTHTKMNKFDAVIYIRRHYEVPDGYDVKIVGISQTNKTRQAFAVDEDDFFDVAVAEDMDNQEV